jgi:6-pyruvoyltetrahydropterin/6-carboxytetrahydropterin synthase
MYAIEVTTVFSASHQLRLPDGALEPLHGHNWHLTARISATKLDSLETVVDFHEVQDALLAICAPMQNQHLNTLEPFIQKWNPSAERVAEHIGRQLLPLLAGLPDAATRQLRLVEIRITEAHNCLAIWLPD